MRLRESLNQLHRCIVSPVCGHSACYATLHDSRSSDYFAGGFAIRAANYNRRTMDVGLIWRRIWKTRRKFFPRSPVVRRTR
jgi:hypothetical protein